MMPCADALWRAFLRRASTLPAEPCWLPVEQIIENNKTEVAATGEPFFVREEGLLHSAWAKPINQWIYEDEHDVVRLAISLLSGLARNHPFEQGNKRTAVTSALMFMDINGYRWMAPDTVDLGVMVDCWVCGKISDGEFEEYMRRCVEPA